MENEMKDISRKNEAKNMVEKGMQPSPPPMKDLNDENETMKETIGIGLNIEQLKTKLTELGVVHASINDKEELLNLLIENSTSSSQLRLAAATKKGGMKNDAENELEEDYFTVVHESDEEISEDKNEWHVTSATTKEIIKY